MYINPDTKKVIDRLKNRLPQAILLTGKRGVGLSTLAKYIADSNIGGVVEPTNSMGEVSHETGSIRIEQIRNLYDTTRSKTTKRSVIIIDDVDRMLVPAANAFLKLLEEPNSNIHFILTSHQPQKLLPTIKSRVQEVAVRPITEEQSKDILDGYGLNETKSGQILFVANGLPALIHGLCQDPGRFDATIKTATDAKKFISSSAYDRLSVISNYSDRQQSLLFLEAVLNLLRFSSKRSPDKKTVEALEKTVRAYDRIVLNGNVKINLASIVV